MLRDPNREGVSAVRGPAVIEQAVAGNAKEPGSGVVGFLRQVLDPPPGHQVRIGDDVFGVVWSGAALHKTQHVSVGAGVQLPESVFVVSFSVHI